MHAATLDHPLTRLLRHPFNMSIFTRELLDAFLVQEIVSIHFTPDLVLMHWVRLSWQRKLGH